MTQPAPRPPTPNSIKTNLKKLIDQTAFSDMLVRETSSLDPKSFETALKEISTEYVRLEPFRPDLPEF